MGLSNAERQARWREKRNALAAEAAVLKAAAARAEPVDASAARLAEAQAKIAALEAELAGMRAATAASPARAAGPAAAPGSPKRLTQMLLTARQSAHGPERLAAMDQFFKELDRQGVDPHTLDFTKLVDKEPQRDDWFSRTWREAEANCEAKERAKASDAATFDAEVDRALAEMLTKRGLTPEGYSPKWSRRNWAGARRPSGVNPWLADDDPLWTEWDAKFGVREEAERDAERAAKRAEEAAKRREQEEAEERAKAADPDAAKKRAEAEADAARKHVESVKRKARKLLNEHLADEAARADFDAAVALFRKRATLRASDRRLVEEVFERATRGVNGPSGACMSPLRAFRTLVSKAQRETLREIVAAAKDAAKDEAR